VKINILYKTTQQPWGGVNTFFRNFIKYSQDNVDMVLVDDYSKSDLILSTGHYRGPGQLIKPYQLRNLSHGRWINNPAGIMGRKGKKKIIIRADGLREIYDGKRSLADEVLKLNLEIADSIIFQSRFSKECFDKFHVAYPDNYFIINNCADSDIFYPVNSTIDFSRKIIFISNSWSTNPKKGFETISLFSMLENSVVFHIGRWPYDIDPRNVKILGEMNELKIAETLRKGHFFLCPSEYEACPNTVVESLASGLPVLYHNSGGTPELCQNERFGMPFPSSSLNTNILNEFTETAFEKYDFMRQNILSNLNIFSFKECIRSYFQHFQSLYF